MKPMLRFLKIVFLGLVLFLSGCASQQGSPLPSGATITNTFDTGSVGTYVSNEDGFNTSTYWIVGPRGVILIDTQFLLSAANEAVNQIQKITGKPVVLAIVLHPNPDKFNGTSVLQKRGIRVVTSQQVLDLIPAVHRDRHYWFYDRFKPDYPDEAPQPESFGMLLSHWALAALP
jgi:glyoxylase-like metal-dependent hydrolase (beta-lactamase superfamily II)